LINDIINDTILKQSGSVDLLRMNKKLKFKLQNDSIKASCLERMKTVANKKRKIDPKYRLEINWSPQDECYVVVVPELPGCQTHGSSIAAALTMADEAIAGYLESLKARHLPIPKPLSEKKFSGKLPLRIDPALHRDLSK
jgi:predicted RNase H-like HicB family nuclease